MTIGMFDSEVACAKPALCIERLVIEAWVCVTREQHRTLDTNLAFGARRRDGANGCHNGHLAPSDRRTLGVGELFVGIRRRTLADHRAFGHAIAMRDRYAHLLFDFKEDLWGLGGATTGHGS